MKLIDKSGYNYLIIEFNCKPSEYLDRFKRWLHVKRVEFGQWCIHIRYGMYTGENGRGRYVWRGGVWVPGHAIDKSIWHTFFDYGMGKMVSGSAEIREHEKQGKIYTTYEEAERESAKRRFNLKMEAKKKVRKSVEKALEDVSRGRRSYAKEIEARIPHDQKLKRDREMAARTGLVLR